MDPVTYRVINATNFQLWHHKRSFESLWVVSAQTNILLHDFFEIRGGGERLSLTLCHGLGLDLCYGFWTQNSYPASERKNLHCVDLDTFSAIPGWRTARQMQAFKSRTGFLKDYDTVMYSGVAAPMAITNHPSGKNVFYCHTPPRFIYDQRMFYLEQLPGWQRPVLNMLAQSLRRPYENAVRKMDVIIANSHNVRQRIQRFLGLDSEVVYPPVDIEAFQWHAQGDYYLSTARLDRLKRVELLVRAFKQMPQKKLVVTSGGEALPRLQALAAGTQNIQFTGWVTNEQLRDLVGNAIATLYIPRDEDFGMSPVESMAAGKPVIGVRSGGLTETIVDEQTGLLLNPDPSVDEIVEAVERLSPKLASSMRYDCEKRATQFSNARFLSRMRRYL